MWIVSMSFSVGNNKLHFFKCEKASYFLQSYNHFSFALWKDWKYLCDSFIYFMDALLQVTSSTVIGSLCPDSLRWRERHRCRAEGWQEASEAQSRYCFCRGWEFGPSTCICWRIAPSNSSFRASNTISFLKSPITHIHMWLQKHGMTCTNIYGTDSKCVM